MLAAHHNRREFLKRAGLIAMAPSVPGFLSRSARAAAPNSAGRILVVVQLDGGNDGINTVVPFADEGYAKHRRRLRLNRDRLIKVNDHVGLHSSLRPAADLLENGCLAIVQGVGYPNPNRSHEVSMAIWQTARLDPEEHKMFGWIGRALDEQPSPARGAPHSILLGNEAPPLALRGRRTSVVSLARLDELKLHAGNEFFGRPGDKDDADLLAFSRRAALDAKTAADLIDDVARSSAHKGVAYPATALGSRLQSVAQLIKSEFSTPVYYAIQSGYDTHAVQLPAHARLLEEFAVALKSFVDDLQAAGLFDRVLVLCFSEFGRRVQENASLGTDHGTAGPVFVAGSRIVPGLIGAAPNLMALLDGDIQWQTDFRSLYATILEEWLEISSPLPLGGSFERLALLKNS